MFGKSKDMEIVEIRTGTLNVHYFDFVTEKRKKTNKYNPGHDNFEVIFSDASEEEFRKLVDELAAEKEIFYRRDVEKILSKNGFFVFNIAAHRDLLVPYQE